MPQVCLNCQKSFKRPTPVKSCPECKSPVHTLHPNFKPPKLKDDEAWEMVGFLIEKGFDFSGWVQKTKNPEPGKLERPGYPTNLKEAKAFAKEWKPAPKTK